jgi:hypothetical protein
VFNAAAKSGEKCLNDFMTCEPALQNPLPVFFRGDLGSNIHPSNNSNIPNFAKHLQGKMSPRTLF